MPPKLTPSIVSLEMEIYLQIESRNFIFLPTIIIVKKKKKRRKDFFDRKSKHLDFLFSNVSSSFAINYHQLGENKSKTGGILSNRE